MLIILIYYLVIFMKIKKIIKYKDYKEFIRDSMPERGSMQTLAKYLKVHPTYISQVFGGDKNINSEQGIRLCKFFQLDSFEQDYFIMLINYARAGSFELRQYWSAKISDAQETSKDVDGHRRKATSLTKSDEALFYSSWQFSAARLSTSLERIKTVDDVAEYLGISKGKAKKIIEFLLQTNLCVKQKDMLAMGPKRVHVKRDSDFVNNHHRNWRLKSMETLEHSSDENFRFTAPISVSQKGYNQLRQILLESVEQCANLVETSDPELLACVSFDLFQLN